MVCTEIIEKFDKEVQAQMQTGLSQPEAVLAVSRQDPALHQQHIEALEELEILDRNEAFRQRQRMMNSTIL